VNLPEWHYIETVWSEYGERIKVSNIYALCVRDSALLNRSINEFFKPRILVLSLQELCCRTIVRRTRSVYSIDTLSLPSSIKSTLKSYALTTTHNICTNNNVNVNSAKNITCKSPTSGKFSVRNNCCIS
jgi:hypothetical protein